MRVISCPPELGAPERFALGLAAAEGALVVCLAPGDVLSETAVYLAARAWLEADKRPAFVFGDEDEIDDDGKRVCPFFKPAHLGELELSQDIAGGAVVYATEALRAINGPSAAAGAAWRWDILLRLTEKYGQGCGAHIPYVILHRRASLSEATERIATGRTVVADHLKRQAIEADVAVAAGGRHLTVRYSLPDPRPSVTAIVLTRDRVDLLRTCLDGLLNRTDYAPLDVLVVDNGSVEAATHQYLAGLSSDPRVRVLAHPGAFNFAAIHNRAVAEAKGEILALVNNDIEVTDSNWLTAMVAHAARPGVGAVGAKLLYPDGRIQHAGLVAGLADGIGHIFMGLPGDDPGPHQLLAVAQEMPAVTAACMVLRRAVWEEVGGMDEAFASNFNDTDLCMRLRQRGYAVVWTPEAVLVHHESLTRGRAQLGELTPARRREVALFRERWANWAANDAYYNPNLTLASPWRGLSFAPRVERPWAGKPDR